MSEIHLKCISHRNFSTNCVNVIIKGNENPEIMIINFIYSRVMDDEINVERTKKPNMQIEVDPARFVAPEFEESSQYDLKIDVFTFASIAYELATGKMPFVELNDATVKEKLARNERPPLDGINKDLADLIAKCWEQDPSKRYSFSQVVHEMVGKRIIVEKENDKVKEKVYAFYDQIPINYSIMDTFSKFDTIKDDMKKSFQFKHILYSTRNILTQCRNYLDTEYKSNDQKSEEEVKKLDVHLEKFDNIVHKTSFNLWCDLKLNFQDVKNEIVQHMNGIIESMKNLGFDHKEFIISPDDIKNDARELYFAYQKKAQEDKKGVNNSEWTKKSKDFKSYIRENYKSYYKDIFTHHLTREQREQFIKDIDKLLANFSKHHEREYNRDSFEEYRIKSNDQQGSFDDLDAVTEHIIHEGNSTIHKAYYRVSNKFLGSLWIRNII